MPIKPSHSVPQRLKFGTFGGVFVPNVLTILGVVMFLRCGWVVGNAGLYHALLILLIAKAVTLLTALSLSAVASNTKAQGGGAYFLVSRSLGLAAGGSIGIPLFLAQAVSVAFYIIGFTESIAALFPQYDPRFVALEVLGVMFILAWAGAGIVIKTQYFILMALAISMISFFLGFEFTPTWNQNLHAYYEQGYSFWTVFGVFFPAVTGITAGVSMSGDLKDPVKSIPLGTLMAIGVTFLIYVAQMLFFGLSASRIELLKNNMIMRDMALFPTLIFVGLWAASLSSALASFVAAPRTLQALARDRIVPQFIGKGYGSQNEPRVALILTLGIALSCILVGNLNRIAPMISMFFLATYGMINLTAAMEHWTANPSYRPTVKIHWIISLLGALASFVIMFFLEPLATLIAGVFISSLYMVLIRRTYKTSWGDMRSGFWFSVSRLALTRLTASRQHMRNWRPVLLVLVGNYKYQQYLVRFAELLESQRGFIFLSKIIVGDWEKHIDRRQSMQDSIDDFIKEEGLSAVGKALLTRDFNDGVTTLLQTTGIGGLRPNTIMLEWNDEWRNIEDFAVAVRHVLQLEKNLIVFSEAKFPDEDLEKRIDVWWSVKSNGMMILTLAYLLQTNRGWRSHTIRLLHIIQSESAKHEVQKNMQNMLKELRIQAQVEIIVSKEEPMEIIRTTSTASKVTFIGISARRLHQGVNPLKRYEHLVAFLKGNLFLSKNWLELEKMH